MDYRNEHDRRTRTETLTDLRVVLAALQRLRRRAGQARSTDDAMAFWSVSRALETRVARIGDEAIAHAERLIP